MLNVGEAEGASGKTVDVIKTVVPDVGSVTKVVETVPSTLDMAPVSSLLVSMVTEVPWLVVSETTLLVIDSSVPVTTSDDDTPVAGRVPSLDC